MAKDEKETKAELPLLGHLDELRQRIIKVSIAIVVGTIVAFLFRNQIYDLLVDPFDRATVDRNLAFFRPTEAFNLFMRISLFGGFVLASPVVIWQVWGFVSPALTKREKKWAIPAVLALTLLFLGGVGLGYWSLQRGLGFLFDFGGERLDPIIGGSQYMSFAMRFIIVFGVAFEFPVFLFAMGALGMVTSKQLRRGRRWAILTIVVVGAVITPSGDPVTLLLLSTPLYLLYEATIWTIRFALKK